MHKLLMVRVIPYYIYQCDPIPGSEHFRTTVEKGLEIMKGLRGWTSGYAIPYYVIDAPGGGGKIPLMPNYIISWSTNKVILRNYEGVITSYQEPDKYEQTLCDRDCKNCNLELELNEGEEIDAIGIERLLADYDDTISLVPANNERFERRVDESEIDEKS